LEKELSMINKNGRIRLLSLAPVFSTLLLFAGICFQGIVIFASARRADLWFAWAYLFIQAGFSLALLLVRVPEAVELDRLIKALRRKGLWRGTGIPVSIIAACWVLALAAGGASGRPSPEDAWLLLVRIAASGLLFCGLYLVFDSIAHNPLYYHPVPLSRDETFPLGGPYVLVRHPGGAGMLMVAIALPLLFASPWAAIPAAVAGSAILRFVLRKDREMLDRVRGYRRYSAAVRYRVIPGVW
jgi:protein-S-isoprenylcysteine O-methyltransferase Ste14